MSALTATGLSVHAGERTLLDRAGLSLRPGELVAMLGPNGAGKTTLLRALLGLQKAEAGEVTLDGKPLQHFTPAARARAISYLPQQRPLAWPAAVREVVALGRYAWGAAPGRLGPEDAEAVARALAACDLEALGERATETLSGGELARVHVARALAAETPLLLADEPAAALDPRQQFRIMGVLKDYVARGGGALVVLHEIARAARFADRLVWMKDGQILADGPVAETLTPDMVREVYGVSARVRSGPDGPEIYLDGPAD